MTVEEQKAKLLGNIDLFSRLREYELDIISRYSEFIRFKKGEVIFSSGDESEELYVIETGRVGIINIDISRDVVIAQLLPGESFGELDLFGNITRTATAVADEESVLLCFPSKGYKAKDIFMKNQFLSACMLHRLLGVVSERIWNVNNMLFEKEDWLKDLRKKLLCDKMTGLYNQVYLKENFATILPDLGKSAALLMIKPDNFKEINDNYGHEAGDSVLNLMAIFLQSELRENDIGVRYRGDEYVAILSNTGKMEAIKRAKDISSTFKKIDLSNIIGRADFKLKVSIGISIYPDNAENSEDMVLTAHRKMMSARETGGNMVYL